jgi:hypothetical protein
MPLRISLRQARTIRRRRSADNISGLGKFREDERGAMIAPRESEDAYRQTCRPKLTLMALHPFFLFPEVVDAS